jgi:hypothetical protein
MRYFSPDQIREVCIAARKAFDAWELREEWLDRHHSVSRTEAFDLWRHLETAKVTRGEQSLRRCVSERHYLPLIAHFADLAGEGGAALKALLRHGEEPRIRVFFKLQQMLASKGLDEGYAAHIARCKFKTPLGDCSEKQLWSLFFDVKNRPAKPVAKPAPKKIAESLGTLSVSHLQACLGRAVEAEDSEEAARLRDLIAAQAAPADLTPAELPF